MIAAVRDPYKANALWQLSAGVDDRRPGACVIHQCDVTREDSIVVSDFYFLVGCEKDRRGVDAGRRGG